METQWDTYIGRFKDTLVGTDKDGYIGRHRYIGYIGRETGRVRE